MKHIIKFVFVMCILSSIIEILFMPMIMQHIQNTGIGYTLKHEFFKALILTPEIFFVYQDEWLDYFNYSEI